MVFVCKQYSKSTFFYFVMYEELYFIVMKEKKNNSIPILEKDLRKEFY